MNMFYLILLIFIAIPNQLFGLGEGLGGREGEDGFLLIDHSDAPTEPLHSHHYEPAKSHTDLITTNPHDRIPAPIERVISDIPVGHGDNGTVQVDNNGDNGSGSVVVDPTKAKDLIADVTGGQTISGSHPAESNATMPDRVADTHKAIHTHLFIEERGMPDLSFDTFLKKFQNDPATFDTYIQKIKNSREALIALKERADASGDTSDAQKCDELLKKLKDAQTEITEFKEKLKQAAPDLASLTNKMSNPKYKFKAENLTKLTTLFDDSLNTDDPQVGNCIRSQVKTLIDTISKKNKGLGRFQRSSLRSMVESMNRVITFLVDLHSNTLTDNEIYLRFEKLSNNLTSKSKTGNLGFSKIRKQWLAELQKKITKKINPIKIKIEVEKLKRKPQRSSTPTSPAPTIIVYSKSAEQPKIVTDLHSEPEPITKPSKSEIEDTNQALINAIALDQTAETGSRPARHKVLSIKDIPSVFSEKPVFAEKTTIQSRSLEQPTILHSYEVATGFRPPKINPSTSDVTIGQQKTLQPTTVHSSEVIEPVAVERKSKRQRATEQAAQEAIAAQAAAEKQAQADQAAAEAAEALAAANKDNTVDAAKAKIGEEKALIAKQEAAQATAAATEATEKATIAEAAAPSVVEPAPYSASQLQGAKIIVNLNKSNPANGAIAIAKAYSPDVAAALIKELLPGQKMPEPKKSIFNKIGLKK